MSKDKKPLNCEACGNLYDYKDLVVQIIFLCGEMNLAYFCTLKCHPKITIGNWNMHECDFIPCDLFYEKTKNLLRNKNE